MNFNEEKAAPIPPVQSIADRLREVLEDVEVKNTLPLSGLPIQARLTRSEITEIISIIDRVIVKVSHTGL